MERYHVDVALAEDDVGPLGFLGQIQSVQNPPFGVHRCLLGVHVLGLRLVQDPAAEGHHVSPHIDDRKDEPVAELVVQAAVPVLHRQACLQQLRLHVALLRHGQDQRVPGIQRGSQTEVHCRGPANFPPVQIFLHRPPLRLLEHLIVEPGRVPVQVQQTLAPAARLPVAVLLRYLHPRPFGQKAHRIREGEILLLHDEVDNAAAPLAAEAVVDLFVRRDGEGAGLLTVEGTQTKEIRALSGQLHIAAHHVHDVTPGHQLVQKALGKGHVKVSSFR